MPDYVKIPFLLHALTRKKTQFLCSADCEIAFEVLKQKLVTSPLLAYPYFDEDFTLETDSSRLGLGAILSQYQDDCDIEEATSCGLCELICVCT